MPYKGGVQLLPETQRRPTLASYTSGNGMFWTGIAIGVGVFVFWAILGSYGRSLNDQINTLDGQLSAQEKSRDRATEQLLLNAQQQSQIMGGLLKSKIYWSQALTAMESMAQSSITLDTIDGSTTTGTIKIAGNARDYATVARQIQAYAQGSGITDVDISNVKANESGGVDFSGTLTIDPRMLQYGATITPKP